MQIVAEMWSRVQGSLFPHLGQCLDDPLTQKLRQLVLILEVVRIEEHVPGSSFQHGGRPRCDRRALARAFVAKAVYNLPTTELLIEWLRLQPTLRKIIGFERGDQVPSAATFSRAFGEFAASHLGERVHEALVRTHIGEQTVLHVCRDATDIPAPEKATPRPKEKKPKEKKKPGRPKKGEQSQPPVPTRLQQQLSQSASAALAALPRECDWGRKSKGGGRAYWWRGYKLHLDTIDFGLPVLAETTSASLHDSQAAIPMMKKTAQRLTSCYDLMDSSYDADAIHQASQQLGHRPIIEIHPRRTSAPPFDPATAKRYAVRTTAERVNSRLKEEFGAAQVRVRGHQKVHLHLMFGIIALFADQLLQLFRPRQPALA